MTKGCKLSLFLFAGLLWFSSCRKIEAQWETDILAPIIITSLDIGDLFGDSNVTANPNQSLSLVYSQLFTILNTDSLISFKDTVSSEAFVIPVSLNIPPGQKVIEKESNTPVDFGDMKLKFAHASKARLTFKVTSTITQPLRITYELLCATKDGHFFSVTEDIPAAPTGGQSLFTTSVELNGYDVDLRGPNADNFNIIYAKTHVWIHPDGDTVKVMPSDSIVVTTLFEEFVPLWARGYLGAKSFLQQSSEELKIFNPLQSGTFNLKEAKASIEFYNYGVLDFKLKINQLGALNSHSSQKVDLQNAIIGQHLNLTRATENGQIYPSYQRYDISQSNLNQLFNIQPDSLYYNIEAQINPLGNISGANDYYNFEKGLETKLSLEIPLNFSAENLVFAETSDFNFNYPEVTGGILNLLYENFFPFDLNLQIYLINSQNQVIDSLFQNSGSIVAAQPIAGIVQNSVKGKLSISLNSNLLNHLQQAAQVRTEARINSLNNQAYQIYQHYKLNVQVIGDFNYEVQ